MNEYIIVLDVLKQHEFETIQILIGKKEKFDRKCISYFQNKKDSSDSINFSSLIYYGNNFNY